MSKPISSPRNYFRNDWIRSSILSLILISISPSANASIAHSLKLPSNELFIAQSTNLDFSDVGRPRRRQGGGSRGSCLIADNPPLTALVPASSTGYTVAQSPSFWFYLPYLLEEGHTLEFVLKDSQDNLVHAQTIAGSDTAVGIIHVPLPAAVVLDSDQSYEWYLLVQCDTTNSERFVFVNGAIRRLDRPDLLQQLTTLDPATHPDVYKAADLWYDAIGSMALQVQQAPQDNTLRARWTNLLQEIGLAELAAEPIGSCCVAE